MNENKKLTQKELLKEFNVIGKIAFDFASDAYKPQVREVCRQIREKLQQKPTVTITGHDEDALFQGTKSFHEKLFTLLESQGVKVLDK